MLVEKQKDSVSLLQDEITRYYKTMNTKLPKDVQLALSILSKHPEIDDDEKVLAVRDHQVKDEDMKDLQKLLKKCGDKIKLLPHFMTSAQRQALEDGKIAQDDLTIDLDTPRGRNAVAKQYSPLVFKIVSQFSSDGCPLDKSELISAGMLGLTSAMNDYKNPDKIKDEGGKSSLTFAQYAGWRIRQAIQDDIASKRSAVYVSAYNRKKMAERGEGVSVSSIDHMFKGGDDEDGSMIDRMIELSENPIDNFAGTDKEKWTNLLKQLEKRFSSREIDIFKRILGIENGKPEKGKDIAKSLGITASAVTQTWTRIIKYISKDEKLVHMVRDFMEAYECSLLPLFIDKTQEEIVEALLSDDVFITLEGLAKKTDADTFISQVKVALEKNKDVDILLNCILGGEGAIKKCLSDKYINILISFLNSINPTSSYSKNDRQSIYQDMEEISSISKALKIDWLEII